jgi:hypothetical protein
MHSNINCDALKTTGGSFIAPADGAGCIPESSERFLIFTVPNFEKAVISMKNGLYPRKEHDLILLIG